MLIPQEPEGNTCSAMSSTSTPGDKCFGFEWRYRLPALLWEAGGAGEGEKRGRRKLGAGTAHGRNWNGTARRVGAGISETMAKCRQGRGREAEVPLQRRRQQQQVSGRPTWICEREEEKLMNRLEKQAGDSSRKKASGRRSSSYQLLTPTTVPVRARGRQAGT